MKYYSEILKKMYDSEKDLLEAEKKSADLKEKVEATKKALAKKVQDADARLDVARDAYKEAEEEAAKILEEAISKIKDIIEPAKEEIKDAKYARAEAIREFNSKYGAYTTTYNGEKALKEYESFVDQINNTFESMWTPIKWIW